ncbi:MAG: gamma carbonic anhydrase family protein [Schwartzia sp.]|nr:gamma carbonic anhydrase family protein [Schwartzia sp. (in: firmicutes)]
MYTFKNFAPFKGKTPQIDEEAFVAPQVYLSGDVRVGKYASLWPGVVARGDVNYISIGECSNVQDLTCLHVADNHPCIIGDYVTIGHGAVVHACTIEDHCLVGMNATILDGAVIGRGSVVAAGALVLGGTVIPPNSLVVGVPAKVVRTQDKIKNIHAQAIKYKCEWSIAYGVYPEIGGEIYHGEQII